MAGRRRWDARCSPVRCGLAALLGVIVVACSAPPSPTSPAPTTSSVAVGSATGQPAATQAPGVTSSPTSSEPPEPATAQALIEAARAAGRIDLVTSLVDRGEALFGLPGLPAEFAGATSVFEDNGLFDEIVNILPTLSPADQARLEPFVVRPTDPASIFASGGTAVTGGSAILTSYTRPDGNRPVTAAVDECRSWVDSGAASPHFKVWTCASADPADDQAVVTGVAATMDGLWARMTQPVPAGMGQPLPDGRGPNPGAEFGGDQRIDVYVLTLDQSVFREGKQRSIPEVAAAIPSEPFNGNTASGFLLVNRDRRSDPEFTNDLIHEFFHILQMAHNYRAMVDATGQLQWFQDASATWAETFYGESDLVHGWFHDFQVSPESLESTDGGHPQAAYIWPVFMQQEAGPAAIFKAWQRIESVGPGDFAGVNAAIDAQLPFKDHFRDFAVRNLNRDILGQVTVPGPEKRYQQLDPTIPDTYWPVPIDARSIDTDGTTSWTPAPLSALTARYLYVAGSSPGRDVTLDLSGLTPTDDLDADVLVHVKDHWERRPVEGTQFTYCRDVPADDIDQLYLVVANHSDDPSSVISGAVTIKAQPCSGWQGTMSTSVSWTYSNGQQTGQASTSFTGIWVQDEDPSKYMDCLLSGAASPEPGTDCPLIYKPIGTIDWSFEAHCVTGDDDRSGTLAAATGFPVPETDWQQQALYLLKTADGQHFQYWGDGELPPLPGAQGKCNAGDNIAGPAPAFFTIFQDAANRPATTNSCFGRSWTIDVTADAISGSCDYRTSAGEYDQSWTWSLQRMGDPTAPPG